MQTSVETSTSAFGEGQAVFVRFSATLRIREDGQYARFTEFDLGPVEELTELERSQIATFSSLEMIGDDNLMYGRGGEFDRWIDITSVLDPGAGVSTGIVPLQAMIEDSELAILLFEQASGDFDPRDIETIEEQAGRSPLLKFEEVPSLPDRIVLEHHDELVQVEEIATVTQSTRIAFRIDPETEFIIQTMKATHASISGQFELEAETSEEYQIEYGPQEFELPDPGDPSIETDPDKIAAFLELFE